MPYIRSYHNDLPPEHVCTDADINDLEREMRDLAADTQLIRLENPTMADMLACLDRAKTYRGPWYHTSITFDMETEVTTDYRRLREQVVAAGSAQGIYAITSYPSIVIDFDESTVN